VQHFSLELDSKRIYGRSLESTVQSYSKPILETVGYLATVARPGTVALPDQTFLGPVLALTKCRVPLGYFANFLVSNADFTAREKAEQAFWKAWEKGAVQSDLLREAKVGYVIVDKHLHGVPAVLPPDLVEVFANSESALFEVK
jgi:hypothetical protein